MLEKVSSKRSTSVIMSHPSFLDFFCCPLKIKVFDFVTTLQIFERQISANQSYTPESSQKDKRQTISSLPLELFDRIQAKAGSLYLFVQVCLSKLAKP